MRTGGESVLNWSSVIPEGVSGEAWDRQVALEMEMMATGRERFRKKFAEAKETAEMTRLRPVRQLMESWIEPLAAGLTEWRESKLKSRGGPRPVALRFLSGIGANVAAYVTVREVLDHMTAAGGEVPLLQVGVRIGNALQDEGRAKVFMETNPELWHTVQRGLDRAGSTDVHRRRVNINRFNTLVREPAGWVDMSDDEVLRVGLQMVDLMTRYVRRFSIGGGEGTARSAWDRVARRSVKTRQQLVLRADSELIGWLSDAFEREEALLPALLPCIVPPRPWSGARSGGYWTPVVRQVALIRFKAHHREVARVALDEFDALEMPAVYEAVNAIQNVAWRINTRVLDVAMAMWSADMRAGVLPQREAIPLPPKPLDIDTNGEARKAWKREAAAIHGQNAKRIGAVLHAGRLLGIAERFRAEDALYFPHHLDFRGRMYPIPPGLQPQGSDFARGVLQFKEERPVDAESAGWIAVHLANQFGQDKIPFDGRIAWVEEREEMWRSITARPLDDLRWTEADAPWQALAAAMEWVRWLDEGEGMMSRLPIRVDGSCNGIQHLAAMLRDGEAGRAVNLTPSDEPQDIYQTVADGLHDILKVMAERGSDDDIEPARAWLAVIGDRVPRALTKRPVMILPYGGTQTAYFEYIKEWLMSSGDALSRLGPPESRSKRIRWLAKVLWSVVSDRIVSGREVMNWLQQIARTQARSGLPILWTAPDGFVVRQFYAKMDVARVRTEIDGRRVLLRRMKARNELDPAGHARGIAPNFVHSMDATALRITVGYARMSGINSLTVIHDSFGTHAGSMWTLCACIREAFADLYEQHDVLSQFRADVEKWTREEDIGKLQAPPRRGSLDISLVRKSDYFFA